MKERTLAECCLLPDWSNDVQVNSLHLRPPRPRRPPTGPKRWPWKSWWTREACPFPGWSKNELWISKCRRSFYGKLEWANAGWICGQIGGKLWWANEVDPWARISFRGKHEWVNEASIKSPVFTEKAWSATTPKNGMSLSPISRIYGKLGWAKKPTTFHHQGFRLCPYGRPVWVRIISRV